MYSTSAFGDRQSIIQTRESWFLVSWKCTDTSEVIKERGPIRLRAAVNRLHHSHEIREMGNLLLPSYPPSYVGFHLALLVRFLRACEGNFTARDCGRNDGVGARSRERQRFRQFTLETLGSDLGRLETCMML